MGAVIKSHTFVIAGTVLTLTIHLLTRRIDSIGIFPLSIGRSPSESLSETAMPSNTPEPSRVGDDPAQVDDREWDLNTGRVLFLRNAEKAEEYLRKLPNEASIESLYLRAKIYTLRLQQSGIIDKPGELSHYEAALMVDPRHLPSALEVARLAALHVEVEEMETRWKDHGFGRDDVEYLAAQTLLERGDTGGATELLHRVLDSDNHRADARFLLARVHEVTGFSGGAIGEYRLAGLLHDDYTFAWLEAARVAREYGSEQQVAETFDALEWRWPNFPGGRSALVGLFEMEYASKRPLLGWLGCKSPFRVIDGRQAPILLVCP